MTLYWKQVIATLIVLSPIFVVWATREVAEVVKARRRERRGVRGFEVLSDKPSIGL